MREREGKRLVPKEEFEALLHVVSCLALSAGEQRLQINHYYDTIDHGLGKEGVCVRIRQTEGRPLAGTVKKHVKNGISEESSFRVERLPRFITYKNRLLHRLGALTTQRTDFRIERLGVLSFDRNFYLGTADYEIELELYPDTPEDGAGRLPALCGGTADKYTRFLSVLERFEQLCGSDADADAFGEGEKTEN